MILPGYSSEVLVHQWYVDKTYGSSFNNQWFITIQGWPHLINQLNVLTQSSYPRPFRAWVRPSNAGLPSLMIMTLMPCTKRDFLKRGAWIQDNYLLNPIDIGCQIWNEWPKWPSKSSGPAHWGPHQSPRAWHGELPRQDAAAAAQMEFMPKKKDRRIMIHHIYASFKCAFIHLHPTALQVWFNMFTSSVNLLIGEGRRQDQWC